MKGIKAESGKFCDLVINPEDLPPDCSPIDFADKSKAFTLKVEQMKQYMATYFNENNAPVGIHIFDASSIEQAHSICKGDEYARGRASYTIGEVVPVASELLDEYKDMTQCSLMVGAKEFARVSAQLVPPTPVSINAWFTKDEK